MDLLLLSNSTNHGETLFSHARDAVVDCLGARRRVAFVPYALADHTSYELRIGEALNPLGIEVVSVHRAVDPVTVLKGADAVLIGGGNTFRLLRDLYVFNLLGPIAAAVKSGMPYIGSSAGTNVAAPTVRTTNDMPIVEPPSLAAFGFIPFQINPHYLDADPASVHMGETRAQRIAQFLEENHAGVLGLREGSWLRVTDGSLTVEGGRGAVWFSRGEQPREIFGEAPSLLSVRALFDEPSYR